jgi:uncharacterized protein (DUF1697 family)
MPRYIAFLRGINLGNRRLPMSRLRELFEQLGFDDVATFIASGNVLFTTAKGKSAAMEGRISRHLQSSLGYGVDTFVRTTDEVAAVGRTRVFAEDGQEGTTIHVGFMQEKLPPKTVRALEQTGTQHDELRVVGQEIYWLCRVKITESKVWSLPAIKTLKLPTMTMRNLKSVRKLIAKHIES